MILGSFFEPVDWVHVRFTVLGGHLKCLYLLDIHICIRTDSMCCPHVMPSHLVNGCSNYYIFTVFYIVQSPISSLIGCLGSLGFCVIYGSW